MLPSDTSLYWPHMGVPPTFLETQFLFVNTTSGLMVIAPNHYQGSYFLHTLLHAILTTR